MRVVLTTPHLRISGGVKVILTVANGLHKMGVHTTVIATKSKHTDLEWFLDDVKFDLIYLENVQKHRKSISAANCMVEHYGCKKLPAFSGPRVLYFQGVPPCEEGQATNLRSVSIDPEYKHVITTSKWLENIVKDKVQVPTTVIPPGIDPIFVPQAVPHSKPLTIGTLYHPSKDKNFQFFLTTIIRLYTKYKIRAYPVILAGSHIEKIPILDYYCLPYSIIYRPPQGVLPYVYSSCDIWLSPSVIEGFGLTTLEAMACGVPTLWVPSFGLEEYMITGKNCIVVDSPKSAAKFVYKIKDNDLYLHDLSVRGMKTAARFRWDNTITQIHDLLKSVHK